MAKSATEALALLKDTHLTEMERITAINHLFNHPTPQAIEALVAALEDDDYAVREHAGTALATLGEKSVPILLRTLAQAPVGMRLRGGARHVLYNNASALVRAESEELLEIMGGPDADVATMEAARTLLESLE